MCASYKYSKNGLGQVIAILLLIFENIVLIVYQPYLACLGQTLEQQYLDFLNYL